MYKYINMLCIQSVQRSICTFSIQCWRIRSDRILCKSMHGMPCMGWVHAWTIQCTVYPFEIAILKHSSWNFSSQTLYLSSVQVWDSVKNCLSLSESVTDRTWLHVWIQRANMKLRIWKRDVNFSVLLCIFEVRESQYMEEHAWISTTLQSYDLACICDIVCHASIYDLNVCVCIDYTMALLIENSIFPDNCSCTLTCLPSLFDSFYHCRTMLGLNQQL